MAHILLQGLRDERVEGWWAAETRGVVKQRLLAKIDTRQGVTGDLGPDLQTWNACASSLLDLALNCVAENRKQRYASYYQSANAPETSTAPFSKAAASSSIHHMENLTAGSAPTWFSSLF